MILCAIWPSAHTQWYLYLARWGSLSPFYELGSFFPMYAIHSCNKAGCAAFTLTLPLLCLNRNHMATFRKKCGFYRCYAYVCTWIIRLISFILFASAFSNIMNRIWLDVGCWCAAVCMASLRHFVAHNFMSSVSAKIITEIPSSNKTRCGTWLLHTYRTFVGIMGAQNVLSRMREENGATLFMCMLNWGLNVSQCIFFLLNTSKCF